MDDQDPLEPVKDPLDAKAREVRADARDARADARDVRADTTDTGLKDREVHAEVREEKVALKEEKISDKEDKVAEKEQNVQTRAGRVTGSTRLLVWLVVVLIVLSAGNLIRSFVNQNATDRSTQASEETTAAAQRIENTTIEARDAAVDTLNDLRAALARYSADAEEGLTNEFIVNALTAITRIEVHLCGGPCPPPE